MRRQRSWPGTLHSTMFSINQRSRRRRWKWWRLYIPLCFLLIPSSSCTLTNAWTPLHSTMFSINQTVHSMLLALKRTLHSTMFSINRLKAKWNSIRNFLYIPLCFLLIIQPVYQDPAPVFLYIPLCFLLIPWSTRNAPFPYSFTFHYVFY